MKSIDPATKELGESCAWCMHKFDAHFQVLAKLPLGYPVPTDAIILRVELQKAERVVHADHVGFALGLLHPGGLLRVLGSHNTGSAV